MRWRSALVRKICSELHVPAVARGRRRHATAPPLVSAWKWEPRPSSDSQNLQGQDISEEAQLHSCYTSPGLLASARRNIAIFLRCKRWRAAIKKMAVEAAVDSLKRGSCVAILDDLGREGEVDLFFPASTISPADMRFLRREAGGELYISIGHEVASVFALPYVSSAFRKLTAAYTAARKGSSVLADERLEAEVELLQRMQKAVGDMCQGSCSVGLSLDHRKTHTGAPDDERSFTCRRLAELWQQFEPNSLKGREVSETARPNGVHSATANGQESLANGDSCEETAAPEALTNGAANDVHPNLEAIKQLGDEFHIPGHIFLCIENPGGLGARQGHTELSVALARKAGLSPLMVGCVMLSNSGDNFGAVDASTAADWATSKGVPFLTGKDLCKTCLS